VCGPGVAWVQHHDQSGVRETEREGGERNGVYFCLYLYIGVYHTGGMKGGLDSGIPAQRPSAY
jgi:hypothetical protein